MTLEIKSRRESGVVILDMLGRLNILEGTFLPRIHQLLDDGERHFVLNLLALEYIDAAGLGQLVSIWTSITSSGGRVTLLHPRKRIRDLLKLTKLDTVFEIFDDEADAVLGHARSSLRSSGGSALSYDAHSDTAVERASVGVRGRRMLGGDVTTI